MTVTAAGAQLDLPALAAVLGEEGGFEQLTGLTPPARGDERARSAGRHAYRMLVRQCHPDVVDEDARELAAETLGNLVRAWEVWAAGTRAPQVVVQTRTRCYEVGSTAWQSEVCAVLATQEISPSGSREVEMRMPHAPGSSDLMVAEARALRRLAAAVPAQAAYFPELLEQIRHRDEHGAERRVNVVSRAAGLVSLTKVIEAYPDGLDPRDAAWMWRRGLVALGAAHRAGLVHASPWPEHIWIEPRAHGVVLDGWWYAVETGHPLTAAVTARLGAYPEEMLVERAAGPGEDIWILTRSMEELVGPRLPAPLRGFVRGCTLPRSQRPQDAWAVLGELDELLERMWGKRRFRPFSMPEVRP